VFKLCLTAFVISLVHLISCAQPQKKDKMTSTHTASNQETSIPSTSATAVFANGCFWCTEAIFEQLEGVISATSGYTDGHVKNPTYKQVCGGETGHAEALQIVYDPSKITFDELLEVFWETHDPTTLNRQGADVGTQYRSGIYYMNAEQKEKSEKYKAELDKSGAFNNPIVTEIKPFSIFYPADNYHQEYFENNENNNPYCKMVIRPKVEKFRKVFKDKLKK
ncbi:MAG: peptide-methionine (S)-S-oxide reductase MsrA, partial [Chitinophagaceae bacterium]